MTEFDMKHMTEFDIKQGISKFTNKWNERNWDGRSNEKSDCQTYWLSLLRDVFGIDNPDEYIEFERGVQVINNKNKKTTQYIDAYIPETKVLIEQKSHDSDLNKPTKQSDGSMLTPFQQAEKYIPGLPVNEHPKWIVTCNFQSFYIYDMNHPNCEPEKVLLKDLSDDYYMLLFLVDKEYVQVKKEIKLSEKACKKIRNLYYALHDKYTDKDSEKSLHSLNVLCVRLVFCFYAEKNGLFAKRGSFYDYLFNDNKGNKRQKLMDLFNVLNTPVERRDPNLKVNNPLLASFPYVNGGLFSDNSIEIPPIDEKIGDLIKGTCADYSWSGISPTIFGAMFEYTLNPETRQAGGMHYTSVENIHKVIDSLFLDDLNEEFDKICQIGDEDNRIRELENFRAKLASLTFLDPACGSGNFLTETYLSLRRLENKAILCELAGGNIAPVNSLSSIIKVNLDQFYGIEINDFAVSVTMTALWIAESQMLIETENIIKNKIEYFPLKKNDRIIEGNAIKMDWGKVIPQDCLSYIIGNPPFTGARLMNAIQKKDVNYAFPNWKNAGNLDYVACWFKKASDFVKGTSIKSAFVATNSIVQGDSVATLWKPLMEDGLHFDFAYRTFVWDSEIKNKANVHCVIIGFSHCPNTEKKRIYPDGASEPEIANNINAYLIDGENIFVESRNHPLCDVPEIGIGNKPIDGGNYLFSEEDMKEFIKKEPASAKYSKPWYGSDEFINSRPRYCLWLGDCTPDELNKMPECKKRVAAVREFRLASKSEGTRKLADKPTRFHVENMPKDGYILIPEVSSEKRKYVPIGFMSPDMLSSNLVYILPSSSLYVFGVLTSGVHMAWMRAVCGRLKSDYRYSKEIVYNNFPWPTPTEEQKKKIEKTAQAILDVRAKYPNASLADLYDDTIMPSDLRSAHKENDDAVMEAYGWGPSDEPYNNEDVCVAELMRIYQKLCSVEKL